MSVEAWVGRVTRSALWSALQALLLAGLVNVLTALVKPEWILPWWWGFTAILVAVFFFPFYGLRRSGETVRRVALASDGDGLACLFVVTQGGAVLSREYRENGAWSAWADHGFKKARAWDVAAVVPVRGGMEVYVVDRSGTVWCRRREARTEWSAWTSLRSDQRIGPVVALDAISGWPGHREIFVVGENGTVGHCWRWDGEQWSAWSSAGLSDGRDVALSAPGKDQMECFVVDRQSRIWHRWYLDGHWSDWARLGEPDNMSAPVAISALSGEERHQELFSIGTSGEVFHRWHWQGEAWDSWNDLKAPDHLNDIAAGITSRSRFQVVAVGRTGKLWQRSYIPVGNWSSWEAM